MSALLFFKKQSKLTAIKTTIFEEYITSYLIRKATSFQECNIADLFCGSGKNGNKLGSPLIIVNIIKKLFQFKYICDNFKVNLFFNDIDEENIKYLNKNLSTLTINKKVNIQIFNDDFYKIYPQVLSKMGKNSCKFFLLDPFGYTDITIEDLQKIFSLPNTEILFFIPIFYAYRFANYQKATGKVKDFLKTYTTKGIFSYKNVYTFSKSIISKISNLLETKYIREFILKDKSQINALFLITKDKKSMLIANNIFWQYSFNGKNISSFIKINNLNITSKTAYLILYIKKQLLSTKRNFNREIVKNILLKWVCEKQAQIIFLKLRQIPRYKNFIGRIRKSWYNIYKYS